MRDKTRNAVLEPDRMLTPALWCAIAASDGVSDEVISHYAAIMIESWLGRWM